ncbi:YfiR family protein [Synoicihabitans lomoniglobus]|uniref:YfiR family protein n=1 Tax=Synoicihabitans lomoniglobus TaxID=2909285 RepID=A0AAE9ZQH0_9BACT|nr:YfiR family protein [Opitutaceae bacterium LMO-M01]WED63210.1 YfiR family protein [Opitutaceae bacterium LMO-M01]
MTDESAVPFLTTYPSRLRRLAHRALLVLSLGLASPLSAAELPFEYQLKAGFLFNFARFVEWPAGTLPEDTPLRLGVIASAEIVEGITEAFHGKLVGGHAIQVELMTMEEAKKSPPHMLFVQRGEVFDFGSELSQSPVLIIGETPGFAASGGTIGFVFRGDRLRFQVNIAAASQASLQLSSQLANYAEIVRSR